MNDQSLLPAHSSSSSSSSSWKIIKVSTNDIMKNLQLFLRILVMTRSSKHFNAFKPGSHKKIKNRDDFKQYLIHPEYRYYML